MGFPRQEYWTGLPFPFPGDLPDPGMELMFPALKGIFFITEPPEKPKERNRICPVLIIFLVTRVVPGKKYFIKPINLLKCNVQLPTCTVFQPTFLPLTSPQNWNKKMYEIYLYSISLPIDFCEKSIAEMTDNWCPHTHSCMLNHTK